MSTKAARLRKLFDKSSIIRLAGAPTLPRGMVPYAAICLVLVGLSRSAHITLTTGSVLGRFPLA